MRCFESMGCGALMVSDAGVYPAGMADGVSILTYDSADAVIDVIKRAVAEPERAGAIAAEGHRVIRDVYSKEAQWTQFVALVANL